LIKLADVARSVYYYRVKSYDRSDKYADIKCLIYYLYAKHKGRYGSPRITLALRNMGIIINHKAVERLMSKELGIKSMIRIKRYKSYKGEVGKKAPNILKRDFTASKPNEKWVTDITEFKLFGVKLYFSPIFDLYNGEIISYNISMSPNFAQVLDMLSKAFVKIGDNTNLILHSDQGWQYRMDEYGKLLEDKGIRQSMSRKGNCLDNAAMESFFGHLKSELLYISKFDSVEHFIKELEDYIYYYNNERIKVKLNGMSPVQYRTHYQLAA
jgi:transposase InsO family protein